jgi:hypothetical protein
MTIDLIIQLLSKSLRNKNPQLELWNQDQRVLSIAHQDLVNYLKVHWGLMEKEAAMNELMDKIYGYFYEKPRELEEFVDLWSGIWIKKWKERVKLILGKEGFEDWDRTDRLLNKAEPVWMQLKQRDEIKGMVIESLIRNGEICGTAILAEDMLKLELASCSENNSYNGEREYLLGVLNNVLRKVRKISRSKGPLIFIRIDKRFFQLLEEDIS